MGEYGAFLEEDAIVVLKARVDTRDDAPKLIVMTVERPVLDGATLDLLRIALPLAALSDATVEQLRNILVEYPGSTPVQLAVGEQLIQLPPEFNVNPRAAIGEIRTLLGPNALVA